jgi:tape measure domain-containing protein
MAKVDIGIIINAVNRASPALRTVDKDVDRLGKTTKQTTGNLRAFHAVVASIATGVLWNFSKRVVETVGSLQMLNIRLANVTGSFENANKTFADLSTRFASAPFDLELVAQGFVRIAAAGLDLQKTTALTDALVNSVAAFGGTGPELERAFLGFSQALGKGVLSMEELRQQISEAIPIATRIMADEAGKSVGQFTADVAKGLVTAEEAVELFTKGAQRAVGNFAESLGFTIPGALARIQTMVKIGLNNLIQNTTFDERLTVIFRNIGDAVGDFLSTLTEDKVRAFFDWLRLIGNQAEKVIRVVLKFGAVVANVLGLIIKAADFLPAEAIEFGILGYFVLGRAGGRLGRIILAAGVTILTVLNKAGVATSNLLGSLSFGFSVGILGLLFFGPLGAGIISIIAAAWHQVLTNSEAVTDSWFGRTVDKIEEALNIPMSMRRKFKAGEVESRTKDDATTAGSAVGDSFWDAIQGTDAQIKEITDQLNSLAGMVNIPEVDTTPFDKNLDKLLKQADNIHEKMSDVIRNITDSLDTLSREIAGDELGETIARINDSWGDTNDKLEDAIVKSMKLNEATGKEADTIKTLEQLMLRNDVLRDKAILKEQQLYDLMVKQSVIQQRITQAGLDEQTRQLNNDNDGTSQFFGNQEGLRIFNEVAAERSKLGIQILETESQIAALTNQLAYETNPAMRESIEGTIGAYERMAAAATQSLEQLSATGKATESFWMNVADSAWGGIENALNSLIEGTFTWRDAMRSTFQELSKLAVRYLMNLAQIKLLETLTGVASGGGGSPDPTGVGGPMFAFAKGGAFNGNVKPFANGDIIAGPTMFGLAGEAGNEAIMPLERIGGKLGVNAAGMGGDSYHFTIQAIDTQSGTEFLMRHMDSIVGGVRQRGRLNHGLARSM